MLQVWLVKKVCKVCGIASMNVTAHSSNFTSQHTALPASQWLQ